uniref:Endo/exonuclease/phosphatase domain-containing protein n=1 Tax=Mesocestoides corti TaxID=53468 RepID=A0A5K3EV61_MESCO
MVRQCVKLQYPYCLFVSPQFESTQHTETGHSIEFQLPFFPRRTLGMPTRNGRVFILKRPATETLSDFVLRLTAKLNTYFESSPKNDNKTSHNLVLRTTEASLNGGDWKLSDSLEKVFSSSQHMEFCLNVETDKTTQVVFDVRFRPARVKSAKLDLKPFEGCPVCPAIAEENMDMGKSKFEWFVSTNLAASKRDVTWTTEPVHEGFVFTPQSEHVGRLIRLRISPYDPEGLPGLPFGDFKSAGDLSFPDQFIVCPEPVARPPVQVLLHKRIQECAEHVKGSGEFRVVGYNLLAFMYSTTEGGRTFFFRHCPPPYLEPEYRFPLLHREILAYNADLLCLQEVDASHFQCRLSFLLEHAGGFEGCHLNKLLVEVPNGLKELPPPMPVESYPRKGEGVATFFRRDRFRLVKKVTIDSIMLFAESTYKDLAAEFNRLSASGEVPLYLCMRSRGHGLLVLILECRNTGQRLLVANTHLYFHPKAMKLRNIQCRTVRRLLMALAKEYSTMVGPDGEILPLPIILAADLNTPPDSEPYAHLVGTAGTEDETTPATILQPAITFPPGVYTNIVPGFKAILDAVFFTSHSTKCLQVSRAYSLPTEAEVLAAGRCAEEINTVLPPLIEEKDGGLCLPNSQFPSDHLALIVDFLISPYLW